MRRIKKKQVGILNRISLKTKVIVAGLVACLAGVLIFFATQTGRTFLTELAKTYHYVMNKTHLSLNTVSIEGHNRTTAEEVKRVLNLTQGMDILDVDLEVVQNRIARLPWVDSVSVERHLPDTIYIRISEKKPIAIWQHNKRYFPLDETGDPIDDRKTVLNNLILVVGRDAPEYTSDLINSLERYPVIRDLVVSAVRVGDRRWNLILYDIKDGVKVYLPETDIDYALQRLIEAQNEDRILEKDFKVIDLRIEDRLIVRTDVALTEEKD